MGKMEESSSDIPVAAICCQILYKAYILHFQALNQCQLTHLECITLLVKCSYKRSQDILLHYCISFHFLELLHFQGIITFLGRTFPNENTLLFCVGCEQTTI